MRTLKASNYRWVTPQGNRWKWQINVGGKVRHGSAHDTEAEAASAADNCAYWLWVKGFFDERPILNTPGDYYNQSDHTPEPSNATARILRDLEWEKTVPKPEASANPFSAREIFLRLDEIEEQSRSTLAEFTKAFNWAKTHIEYVLTLVDKLKGSLASPSEVTDAQRRLEELIRSQVVGNLEQREAKLAEKLASVRKELKAAGIPLGSLGLQE